MLVGCAVSPGQPPLPAHRGEAVSSPHDGSATGAWVAPPPGGPPPPSPDPPPPDPTPPAAKPPVTPTTPRFATSRTNCSPNSGTASRPTRPTTKQAPGRHSKPPPLDN